MASKRAEQRRIQMSVAMSPEMFNTIRDLAHARGESHSAVVCAAVAAWLKTNYPQRSKEVQE